MSSLKKNSVVPFVREIMDNLESFEADMIERNFSARNNKEWFKLLGDYLDLTLIERDFSKDDDFDTDED